MDDRHTPLPARPPPPAALYTRGVRTGGLLHISGQGPADPDGVVMVRGVLGGTLDLAEVLRAARLAARNVMAILAGCGPSAESRVIRLLVAVAVPVPSPDECGEGLPAVADAVLETVLVHSAATVPAPVCTVIGVPALPFGIPVEVEALCRLA